MGGVVLVKGWVVVMEERVVVEIVVQWEVVVTF